MAAQAPQALAAGLAPHSDFNRGLLKPMINRTAQIIIHGQVGPDLDARDYHTYKLRAMGAVLVSWRRLTATYDAVLVEGAGSPAEINLRDRDIANMGFAEAVDCPVILMADIDRGGVFAHLVGTLDLPSPTGDAAVRLWNAVTAWVEFPDVFELQQPKTAAMEGRIVDTFKPYLEARDWVSINRGKVIGLTEDGFTAERNADGSPLTAS